MVLHSWHISFVSVAGLALLGSSARPSYHRHQDAVAQDAKSLACDLEVFASLDTSASFGDAKAFLLAQCQETYPIALCNSALAEIWQGQDLTAELASAGSDFCSALQVAVDMAARSSLVGQSEVSTGMDRAASRKVMSGRPAQVEGGVAEEEDEDEFDEEGEFDEADDSHEELNGRAVGSSTLTCAEYGEGETAGRACAELKKKGEAGCDNGDVIDDKKTCKLAVKKILNAEDITKGTGVKNADSKKLPFGCSINRKNKGRFNSHPEGKAKAKGYRVVCEAAKRVKVFVLMGQSNMVGFGEIAGDRDGRLEHAVKQEELYPFLVDENGDWTQRDDVRNVFVLGSGFKLQTNEWMQIRGGRRIGPEIGIGHLLGNYYSDPVLILKVCIGNRALGWDLLPPGSVQYEFTDSRGFTHVRPGYGGSPESWLKGEEPEPINWHAGTQYDTDVSNAHTVLSDLANYGFPEASYDVVGFFWWQGDRDSRSEMLSNRYRTNLIQLVRMLRRDFDAPNAKFVTASLGQTEQGGQNSHCGTDGDGTILDAMVSITTDVTLTDLHGSTAAVYTHPLSQGGCSGGHYSHNAKTYMNVGLAMGEEMVKLLR